MKNRFGFLKNSDYFCNATLDYSCITWQNIISTKGLTYDKPRLGILFLPKAFIVGVATSLNVAVFILIKFFTEMQHRVENLPSTIDGISANVQHNEIVQNLNELLFSTDVKTMRDDFNTLLHSFITHPNFKNYNQSTISNILFTVQQVTNFFCDTQLLIDKNISNGQ